MDPILQAALNRLLGLVSGGGVVSVLKDIVTRVIGGGNFAAAEQQALEYFNGRLDAQEGRTSAKTLGRAMLKQAENAMSPHSGTPAVVDVEARIAVGQALFQNGALQLTQAGAALLALGDAQAALERARGTATEAEAREAREAAEALFSAAILNAARVTAGAAPQ